MVDGILELRWEREASGALSLWLLEVMPGGQYSHRAREDFGPFDGPLDVAQWLTRQLALAQVVPTR